MNGGEQGWQGGGSRRGTGGELTVKEEVHGKDNVEFNEFVFFVWISFGSIIGFLEFI